MTIAPVLFIWGICVVPVETGVQPAVLVWMDLWRAEKDLGDGAV